VNRAELRRLAIRLARGLRANRRFLGKTRTRLARDLGVTVEDVQRWEWGEDECKGKVKAMFDELVAGRGGHTS
jgi:DNA-binding transcriptional regulator YiaG